ncbi:MAG: histidinol-phosphatase [Bacteroidota bacterium]
MQFANHHAHTSFSDGKGTPEKYLDEAIKQGLHTYGFSDHAPIPVDGYGLMEMDALPEYLSTIGQLREHYHGFIQIYKSLEVDYIPGIINVNSEHVAQAGLDYTIGAVHSIGFLPNGKPWGFESSPSHFKFGVETLFGGDVRAAVTRYFELVREMVLQHCPDIVAHVERIRIINKGGRFFNPRDKWYQDQLYKTLKTIARSGAILEINTKGIVQENRKDVFPSLSTIAHAYELGMLIHLSSDAHHPKMITRHFEHASQALRHIGCKSTIVMMDGRWQEMPLKEASAVAF